MRGEGRNTVNILGQRHGRLTVIKWAGTDAQRGSKWLCKCDCGNEVIVRRRNLLDPKNTRSCGCHRIDIQRTRLRKHGNSDWSKGERAKEYICWNNILQRCYNPKHKSFRSYGAKGVQVCPEWRYDFSAFLAAVGAAPFAAACIDRIDPFGNYTPENVRWVDKGVSDRNKRK